MGDGLSLSAAAVLGELSRLGVRLEPRGNELAFTPAKRVSTTLRHKLAQHKCEILGVLRRDALYQEDDRGTVTAFIALSGRRSIWQKLRSFLDRQTFSREKLRLVLCDTSQSTTFAAEVRSWLMECDYQDVRYLAFQPDEAGLADQRRNGRDRTRRVHEACARIYNRARKAVDTQYVWFLEDDVIPPDDVLSRLLVHFADDVACVSAPYRSRFDNRFMVWDRDRHGAGGVHRIAPKVDQAVQDIRGSGFGCLVVRSDVLAENPFGMGPEDTWFDVAWFRNLDSRWRRLCDWSCECEHLNSTPNSDITRRNLIYHVTPIARNDIWRRNVQQLLPRMDLFNGRRVIAIATGDGLAPPDEVMRAFAGFEVEFLTRPNSRVLRENVTFMALLERVANPDPAEATFYAHAKGVTRPGELGPELWRNAMYHELLDDWPRVADLLESHAIVGTHRRYHAECTRIFPDGYAESPWHFAGTFFWLRNQDTFVDDRWRTCWQPTGWGAEAWPGRMFRFEQSACVAFDGLETPYEVNAYPDPIRDDEVA